MLLWQPLPRRSGERDVLVRVEIDTEGREDGRVETAIVPRAHRVSCGAQNVSAIFSQTFVINEVDVAKEGDRRTEPRVRKDGTIFRSQANPSIVCFDQECIVTLVAQLAKGYPEMPPYDPLLDQPVQDRSKFIVGIGVQELQFGQQGSESRGIKEPEYTANDLRGSASAIVEHCEQPERRPSSFGRA